MVERQITGGSVQDSAIASLNVAVGTIAAIHQPNYIPWLGYFFKIAHADKFVFLDNVVYPDSGFVNRNCIKTPSGSAWLTIPVNRKGRRGQLIGEVETDDTHRWTERHLTTLRCNYGRAPYFKETLALLEPHYRVIAGSGRSLADFNIGMICSIVAYLGFNPQFIRASELSVSGHKTDLILDICRAIGARTYLAGTGWAKSCQEDEKLEEAGITPVYSSFSQQSYPQLFGQFVGNLSVVDVLMNCGCLGTRRLLSTKAEHG
ncbi:MAG: WbqC-like family protein [Bryobacterales bacterium]|nr:WbqC-like family protein [Bryobacterales bacterium]